LAPPAAAVLIVDQPARRPKRAQIIRAARLGSGAGQVLPPNAELPTTAPIMLRLNDRHSRTGWPRGDGSKVKSIPRMDAERSAWFAAGSSSTAHPIRRRRQRTTWSTGPNTRP